MGVAAQPTLYNNSLLKALGPEIVNRLHLKPVAFELRHEIEFPGKPIKYLFFLERGMASLTVTHKDGAEVEVGMFGFESVIGVSALMGTKRSLNRVYTQIAGDGYRCNLEDALEEFRRGGLFQNLSLRYVQAQLVQTMQSASCNAKHHVHQRLARWLLICADRAHSKTFKMSQFFLAQMLGNRRPFVTQAMGHLREQHLVAYTQGTIHILNVPGLEAEACECYQVIKDHLDNFLEFDTGIAR